MLKAPMNIESPALVALPFGEDSESAVAGLPLLRLLQLASAALPIGAFAYSQGLEQAVAMGWVTDEASAQDWILGLLTSGLGTLDLPVLVRLLRAVSLDDGRATRYWNDFLLASRASAELQAEERHLGGALAKVLAGVGVSRACDWAGEGTVTYAAMFAVAAVRWRPRGTPLPGPRPRLVRRRVCAPLASGRRNGSFLALCPSSSARWLVRGRWPMTTSAPPRQPKPWLVPFMKRSIRGFADLEEVRT